jgi:hypothetical protein
VVCSENFVILNGSPSAAPALAGAITAVAKNNTVNKQLTLIEALDRITCSS